MSKKEASFDLYIEQLHEYLRNYGGLGEDEKPLVVSAILLALREQKYGFKLEQLTGDTVDTDGKKLFSQLTNSLQRAKVAPETKKERVLNQFTLIKDRPQLNEINKDLGKTPLKFYAEYINTNIFKAIVSNSPEDYLGRFYGEFVSYSGGDGQTLGVVLTPRHITELFCELVDLKKSDVIFDPCCGTGGFLVAGMHAMIKQSDNEEEKKSIKQKSIFGIEIRDDMFAIATTNMILRGDGRSNLVCSDFFKEDTGKLQLFGATVGFMNPPYSQAKNKETAHLSELCFINQLLHSMSAGGKCAVIVPVSTMIGKTKEDRAVKTEILKENTLEGVISLNTNTFYGIGTIPCVAVFTTGEPHPVCKLVKFINFEDDGFEVKKHLGLLETERAKDRKQYMLDCWRGIIDEAPSKFMVKTTVEDSDEWLHSFYYYNDEIPSDDDFMNKIADYLIFEFNMVMHNRGYLFKNQSEAHIQTAEILNLHDREWKDFEIGFIFPDIARGQRLIASDRNDGQIPYYSASSTNNGVTDFISNPLFTLKNKLVVSTFCDSFFALGEFTASDEMTIISNEHIDIYSGLFISTVIKSNSSKYTFGHKAFTERVKKQKILLPVNSAGEPDYNFMSLFIKERMERKKSEYKKYTETT